MWYTPSSSLRFTRRWLLIPVIIVFLPIIPLITKPRSPRHDDQVTSSPDSDANCVLTATSPAQHGRVIGMKKMAAGRLGNDMFVYASLLGIAARNKMVPIFKCDALARTFNVTGTGNYVINPPAINVYEDSPFR